MTKKVIIIDDSIVALKLLENAFSNDGWSVWCAKSAKDALELIFDVAPDLIITDAIMPVMGGFKLIKIIRQDSCISKIPIIVYSLLDEKNAKFYINEESGEFFLKKDSDSSKILELAYNAISKFPLDDDYKTNILKEENRISFQRAEQSQDIEKEPQELQKRIDYDKMKKEFEKNYAFKNSDSNLLAAIFEILYPVLKHSLLFVCFHSFENNEKIAYFDIRDVILSPSFKDNILNKYSVKESVLFKKYTPNPKMLVDEDEFRVKVEFSFDYNTTIIFYSMEENIWQDINFDLIKDMLDDFFKARYIYKSKALSKKDTYSSNTFENVNNKNDVDLFLGIIEITNYNDINFDLSDEEMDIFNLKISERLVNCIENDEMVFKHDKNEYVIVIYARNERNAYQRLSYISDFINIDNSLQIAIGAIKYTKQNKFDFYEAQKAAKAALFETTEQEKVVIKDV